MNTKYFSLLTDAGTDKLKKAVSSGTKLEITHMVVGDGGGSLPTPDSSQSKLINEKHRAEIDALAIDPNNPNQIIAEQIIPEGKGNWWVREIGLLDKDGTLVAIGNCADLYKPESKEQTVRMSLTVNNSNLTGWISGLLSGLATRKYVRNKIEEHAESRNHPSANLKEKGFVVLSNAVNSDNETQAATPKAIKTTYELANQAYQLANSISSTDKYVPLTRRING
ncbi:phage tail protein, partial [Xenorhabdus sp. Reich]